MCTEDLVSGWNNRCARFKPLHVKSLSVHFILSISLECPKSLNPTFKILQSLIDQMTHLIEYL